MSLSTAQIGRAGEYLVSYRLLLLGVDSSPMSTDAGIDIVAYSPKTKAAKTIQVKTNLKAKPGGGKGKESLDWWIPDDTPAELLAFVDLSTERVWMFRLPELSAAAQQHPAGKYHFFMYIDPTYSPRKAGRVAHMVDFEKFLLQNRAHELFDA